MNIKVPFAPFATISTIHNNTLLHQLLVECMFFAGVVTLCCSITIHNIITIISVYRILLIVLTTNCRTSQPDFIRNLGVTHVNLGQGEPNPVCP